MPYTLSGTGFAFLVLLPGLGIRIAGFVALGCGVMRGLERANPDDVVGLLSCFKGVFFSQECCQCDFLDFLPVVLTDTGGDLPLPETRGLV